LTLFNLPDYNSITEGKDGLEGLSDPFLLVSLIEGLQKFLAAVLCLIGRNN
jgi:hypothetical protein